jgi:hypothetical protein
MESAVRDPRTVGVIGVGPRGLSVLERLVAVAHTIDGAPETPLVVDAIDSHAPGAGRIWRPSQSGVLLMNTVVGQITIFGPDLADPRRSTGPAFLEWLRARGAGSWGPDDYAPRRLYGEYLVDAMRRIVARAPSWMSIRPIRDEVVGVSEARGRYLLACRKGPARSADFVVLATGHPPSRPAEPRVFAGDSPADMALERIAAGEAVAVRGLGLTFYDVVALLTEGRGGTFRRDRRGRLVYRASGEEPQITAGSRSGLPFPARGANQKRGARDSYRPAHCTAARIDFLRERALHVRGDRRLDFKREVLPLVVLEVHRSYLANVVRHRHGERRARAFLKAFDSAPTAVWRRLAVADAAPPDLDRLARPFAGMRYSSPRHFHIQLMRYLEGDLRHAAMGNRDGPLKGALDGLRDLRGVIRYAVDDSGLLPHSQAWFEAWYTPRNALLSAGPPMFRVEQLLALMRAGVVRVVGPGARIVVDAAGACVRSPQVAGSARRTACLVEANCPDADLRRPAPLYAQLLADGLVTAHVNPAAGDSPALHTGGVAVAPGGSAVLDATGRPSPRLFALGIPTERARWFTQVGSSRPGIRTAFTRDAEGIAMAIHGRLRAPVERLVAVGD